MEEMNYIGEKENNVLHLEIYGSNNGVEHMEYTHYCDDGESFNYRDGEYNEYNDVIDAARYRRCGNTCCRTCKGT